MNNLKNITRELQVSSPRYRERLRDATIRQIENAHDKETINDRRDLLGAIDDAERAAYGRTGNEKMPSLTNTSEGL